MDGGRWRRGGCGAGRRGIRERAGCARARRGGSPPWTAQPPALEPPAGTRAPPARPTHQQQLGALEGGRHDAVLGAGQAQQVPAARTGGARWRGAWVSAGAARWCWTQARQVPAVRSEGGSKERRARAAATHAGRRQAGGRPWGRRRRAGGQASGQAGGAPPGLRLHTHQLGQRVLWRCTDGWPGKAGVQVLGGSTPSRLSSPRLEQGPPYR